MDSTEYVIIKALDPNARIMWSEYTDQFFVQAQIDIGDGALLGSIVEHRDTPDEAVLAFFARCSGVEQPEFLVTKYHGERRERRWNGAAFAECTRLKVVAAQEID